jgi:hypothetical protein
MTSFPWLSFKRARMSPSAKSWGYIPLPLGMVRVIFIPKLMHTGYVQAKYFHPIRLASFILKTHSSSWCTDIFEMRWSTGEITIASPGCILEWKVCRDFFLQSCLQDWDRNCRKTLRMHSVTPYVKQLKSMGCNIRWYDGFIPCSKIGRLWKSKRTLWWEYLLAGVVWWGYWWPMGSCVAQQIGSTYTRLCWLHPLVEENSQVLSQNSFIWSQRLRPGPQLASSVV